MIRIARVFAAALCAAIGVVGPAQAADYPTRPVKWVVPYPPGGTTDVLARIVAEWLTQKMGQTFLIENKPGAGNNIGVEAVVNAPPDGYTMLLVNPANGINATLYKNLSFNFIRDIAPVAGLVRTPNVMEVTNSLPVKTVQEFIAHCKANPGKINMASSGSGTSVHLSGELFKSMTGCDMVHVPYKGAGPALTDLMGGQVHVIFDNLPSSIGHIRAGKLRALAVTTKEPDPALPGVPTVHATVPGYEATAWFGIGVPKGTPREVVDKLNAEVNRALADPKMKEKLAEMGGRTIPGTPEDFGRVMAEETARWEKVVKASGAKAVCPSWGSASRGRRCGLRREVRSACRRGAGRASPSPPAPRRCPPPRRGTFPPPPVHGSRAAPRGAFSPPSARPRRAPGPLGGSTESVAAFPRASRSTR